MVPFLTVQNHAIDVEEIGMTTPQLLAYSAKQSKDLAKTRYNLLLLQLIRPTSTLVKRLLSKAKLVMTDLRSSITPYTFEVRVMLSENRDLWMNEYSDKDCLHVSDAQGFRLVHKIMRNPEVAQAAEMRVDQIEDNDED